MVLDRNSAPEIRTARIDAPGRWAPRGRPLARSAAVLLASVALTFAPFASARAEFVIEGAAVSIPATLASPFILNDLLVVGASRDGTLTVERAGSLATNSSIAARQAGTTAGLRVTGSGSRWQNSTFLILGAGGEATLSVDAGGQVSTASALLAEFPGSRGHVDLTGAGSQWSVGGVLTVGAAGSGSIALSADAGLSSAGAVLGDLSGATGNVALSGAGSRWVDAGAMIIGNGGTGRIEIAADASVSSSSATLGALPGGVGSASVTGAASRWDISTDLMIGEAGSGELTIAAGGSVFNLQGIIGADSGSLGAVTVAGAGSLWQSTGRLGIGLSGNGSLSVFTGAHVTAAETMLAETAGSSGSVLVHGDGSQLETIGTVTVGGEGTASATISGGGSLTSTDGFIAASAGSQGTVRVEGNGSVWNNAGDLAIGAGGTGQMRIETGGRATSQAATVGQADGSTGQVTVSGSGSLFDVTALFEIGRQGAGSVMVETGAGLATGDLSLGSGADGTGSLTLDGEGSSLSVDGTVVVGEAGTGSLSVLDSASAKTGATTLGLLSGSEGNAVVSGEGSAWAVDGGLTIGGQGDATVTLRNGGRLDAGTGTVEISDGAGGDGRLVIGADSGEVAVSAGSLTAGRVDFGAGEGMLIFNHAGGLDGADVEILSDLSGNGSILVEAGRTVLSGNGSAFSGNTQISGGTLAVEGSLAGTLAVEAGARLEGSGTVGETQLAAGAVLAPEGDGSGLTIDGDLTLASGATLDTSNYSGNSTAVTVTGTAHLGGASVVIAVPDVISGPGTLYTVLSAGSVDGTFASVTSSSAFLDTQLAYDATGVSLTFARNSQRFADISTDVDAMAVGQTLDQLDFSNPVYSRIVGLNAVDSGAALTALAGDLHASTGSVLVDQGLMLAPLVLDRVQTAFADAGPGIVPRLSYAPEEAQPAFQAIMPAARTTTAWASAYGGRSQRDSGFDDQIGGVVFGLDAMTAGGQLAGLMAGTSRSSFGTGQQTGEADSLQAGLYGGVSIGDIRLSGGAVLGHHRIRTQRDVAFGGLQERLTASYAAVVAQAFAEVSTTMQVGPVSVEPFAGVTLAHLRTEDFVETGGIAALSGAAETRQTGFSTLGLRLSNSTELAVATLRTRLLLGWRHGFGDLDGTATLALSGTPGFDISGTALARDSALIEAGADLLFESGISGTLSYGGVFSRDASAHRLKLGVSGRF